MIAKEYLNRPWKLNHEINASLKRQHDFEKICTAEASAMKIMAVPGQTAVMT